MFWPEVAYVFLLHAHAKPQKPNKLLIEARKHPMHADAVDQKHTFEKLTRLFF